MSQILHIHHETQLEVLLPISSPILSNYDESSVASIHPVITRLKSYVFSQKSYKGYLAALLELQNLQLTKDESFG